MRVSPSFTLRVFSLLCTALLAASGAAEPPKPIQLPPGLQRVTAVEGITEYSLPNGLRVLLFPDTSRPIVTVNITYRVGSRHEDYGETGMAHLLEHLVFKGTPKHPNIPQELTEHGARANGTTWFDRTNYYETVAATDENLRWALELEADRMVNSHISRADLEKEFSVVRNEFERGENSPSGVLYKRLLPAIFQWHNYGHATIGEKSDIEGAPIERLQAFYRHYYQPDNAVLVVAGRLDEQKTLEMIAETFGKLPKPDRVLRKTYTREPVQDGERQITLRRTGDVQLVSCMFRSPAGSHPDDAALTVLTTLLTDEPSGRLYKALVESKKAASVSGDTSGFAEAGMAGFTAEVRMEKSLDDVRVTMLQVLADLAKNPPTNEEVGRARTRLLKFFEMSLKQSDRIGLRLSESIALGDWRLAFLVRDQLEQVTTADVARVATQYFKTSNRTIGLFIPEQNPERTVVPEPPDLTVLLKDYQGKAAITQGEVFEASPGNIEKRTTRGQLANGLKFALLPKETRGDAVSATLTLRFGTLEALKNKSVIADFTASMLDKGTRTKTRQQIKDTLDRLKAQVSISGGANNLNVRVETDREHLVETLHLVREILREPSFPADEFDKLKQEELASLEQQKTDPQALAGNLFARMSRPHLAVDDPRYTRTFPEEAAAIERTQLADLTQFYQAFYGATDATAAVVGDFDAAAVEGVLRSAFGDWKSPGPFARIADDYVPAPAKEASIPTPDKANAVYIAGYGFPMRDDDPDYPALNIGGYIFGGGFLNSRLATRIRQKEGLSYGVGGGFGASPLDQNGTFNAAMIYNPQNVAKLAAAFREEVERAVQSGVTAEELETAKTGWLKSRDVSRSNDGALAGTLSAYLYYGRDLFFDAQREEMVRGLTVEKVNAVLKKYLDYSRLIIVKAGDFKEPAKPQP